MAVGQGLCTVFLGGLRQQLKAIRKEPRNLRIPMFARAADACARQKSPVLAKRKRALRSIVTKRDGFLREILHHAKTNGVVKLIHVGGILGWLAGRATFQDDDGKGSACAKLFGHKQTGPTAADNDGV